MRIVTFKEFPINFDKLYERDWLMHLFGGLTQVHVDVIDAEGTPPGDVPVVLFARPNVRAMTTILKGWSDAGAKFKLLHLSDELADPAIRDSLEAYTFPGCVGVLRTYIRDDFPPGTESKIQVIPLGYHFASKSDANLEKFTPSLPFREFHWSFFGTDWCGRKDAMKPLIDSRLWSQYEFFNEWNDPASLKREAYLSALMNTIFVPCPDGINPETFRFYEALQAGCIPLVVRTKRNEAWFTWVSKYIPLMSLSSWEDALRIMVSLLTKPETLEIYRSQVLQGWMKWSALLREQGTRWLKA